MNFIFFILTFDFLTSNLLSQLHLSRVMFSRNLKLRCLTISNKSEALDGRTQCNSNVNESRPITKFNGLQLQAYTCVCIAICYHAIKYSLTTILLRHKSTTLSQFDIKSVYVKQLDRDKHIREKKLDQ